MTQISIITPMFNGARYVADCIENVAAQGFSDMEHLVMDGGSTDGSVEILTELTKTHPHLRLVSEKDRGQSDAMNKGLRLARGSIIGFLNVDDFYEPGAVKEAMKFLAINPRIDFVAGDCRKIDANGQLISINRPRDLRLESFLLGAEFAEFPINPSAYFYRKRVHDRVGEYNVCEHYAMDLEFLLACAAKVKMTYVPRLWGNFRWMPGTKTFTDPSSRARRDAIMSKWKATLSPYRHLNMQAIKIQKRAKRKARHLWNRWGSHNGLAEDPKLLSS